jgi:hypothetical protein
MKRIAIATILSTAAAANAQSFNVDFNVNAGAGAGAPAATFKGAAGQGGFWNSVGSQTLITLSGLDGAATGVTLTRSGGGSVGSNSTAALTGDDEKLLEDGFEGSGGVTINFTFSNLQAGTYALYTYAIDPSSWTASTVNVTGSTSQTNQTVGTMLSGPNYFVGATHALNIVTVSAGGSVAASIAPTGLFAEIAGFQLVKLPSTLLRMYVDDSAVGIHNGASWAEAFTNPVTALSTARVAGGQNCEIWVANGFYKPTTTNDRYASFDVPSHLKFYGGFTGNETSVDQRGLTLCYLNGEIGDAGTDTDNCYVVVNADFTAADTLIDGFRIHNGYNDEGSIGGGKGAGIRLLSGSATVRDCTFVDNQASNYGGGAYVYNGTPKFINCLFYQDQAFRGSGLYCEDASPVRVYNCEFMDNYGFDGTLYMDGGLHTVAGCYFHGNYGGGNGGAAHLSSAIVTFAGCTIAGNSAGGAAGGVYARNNSAVGIQNSILWANQDNFNPTMLNKQYFAESGSAINIASTTAQGAAGSPGLDPLFVDGNGADNVWGTFDDNCHLQANSPCVNGGGNALITSDMGDIDQDGNTAEQIPVDFDGNTRIRDTVVDRGAFEFQPPCDLAGDLNGDGSVDLTDLATLLGNYGTLSGANADDGDTDGDHDVDLADLTALLSSFGQSCP